MAQFELLKTEIADDPLGRGYAAMTDAEAADSLNTANRTVTRETLSSADIYETIVVSEFQALSDAAKVYVRDILALGGDVRVGAGSKARTVLIGTFGGGSATITALAAAITDTVSRATELGLGFVHPGDIENARY